MKYTNYIYVLHSGISQDSVSDILHCSRRSHPPKVYLIMTSLTKIGVIWLLDLSNINNIFKKPFIPTCRSTLQWLGLRRGTTLPCFPGGKGKCGHDFPFWLVSTHSCSFMGTIHNSIVFILIGVMLLFSSYHCFVSIHISYRKNELHVKLISLERFSS